MTNANQTADDSQTPPRKKRVNITIYPGLHDTAKKRAKVEGTNFSEFVARALHAYMEPGDHSTQQKDIQPVIEQLDAIEEKVESGEEQNERLLDLIEEVTSRLGPTDEHVAQKIERELGEADSALSIPDLTDRLSLDPKVVESGLKHLEQRFAIQRIDSESRDTGTVRWKLLE